MKVLVIDNYDSFVYNLVQYIGEFGGEATVYRNDKLTLKQAMRVEPERIVISPGPGTPEKTRYFGICSAILQHMSQKTPTLGVCLGHQGIVNIFGGKIVPAKRLMHGKTSLITVHYAAYRLVTEPKNRIIIGAYGQVLAESFSRKIRRIVANQITLSEERSAASEWETVQGKHKNPAVGKKAGAPPRRCGKGRSNVSHYKI